jgi:SAM-dependent methyltransferase
MANESLQECLNLARARLNPSLTNPNYLVLSRRQQLISNWVQKLPGQEWHVLDIGGRYQPYRPLVESKTKSYIALDIIRTPLVDVIGRGESLPFAKETFNLVIATQVFEYFPNPHLAAAEMHRILKSGGSLIMSVAAVAPRFVDEEHWRYLPAGLRSLLSMFSSVEIVPEVRSAGSFFRSLNLSFMLFAKNKWLQQGLRYTLIPVLNVVGIQLEALLNNQNDQMAANYSVLARK